MTTRQMKKTSQTERKKHLISLGWSQKDIDQVQEIPWQVYFLENRKLTRNRPTTESREWWSEIERFVKKMSKMLIRFKRNSKKI